MRLVCDADVDRPLVLALRGDGHEVLHMREIEPQSTDESVLERANSAQAVLITRDKGFGSLVFRQGLATHGVPLLRFAGVPMPERKSLLLAAIRDHGSEFVGAFAVLTKRGLRIRRRHE